MQHPTTSLLVICLGILMSSTTFADSEECPAKDQQKANIQLEKAETAVKTGQHQIAYNFATGDNVACVSTGNSKRVEAVLSSASLKLGDEASKNGQHEAAFNFYNRGKHKLEAERAQMKLAQSKPNDANTVVRVMVFLDSAKQGLNNPHSQETKREARLAAIETYLKELHVLIKKNGDKALADEDKSFNLKPTGDDSLKQLESAKEWFRMTGKEKQVLERAEKRGDNLAANDSRKSLECAISYYEFSEKAEKIQQVKDKARKLGDTHAGKGEHKVAADYYNIAGLDDKAEKLMDKNEADMERAESKRKTQFKKDQKSLEQELGL